MTDRLQVRMLSYYRARSVHRHWDEKTCMLGAGTAPDFAPHALCR